MLQLRIKNGIKMNELANRLGYLERLLLKRRVNFLLTVTSTSERKCAMEVMSEWKHAMETQNTSVKLIFFCWIVVHCT